MRISQTGSSFKSFTLIELLIVLIILSILLFIISPRFVTSLNPEKTANFVLRLKSTLVYLSEKSILEKKIYLFIFDLEERRYLFTISEEGNPEGEVKDRYLNPVSFPQGLLIERVRVIPGDEVNEGRVFIPFTPNGILYSFEIIFRERDGQYLVIRGNSLNGRISLSRISSKGEELIRQ